jgi:Na+-translocating ferredoxin:NAD+ oxidoreductase RnfC subunit
VKLGSTAEFLIVNAAECEPLLHKDKELLAHRAEAVIAGADAAARLVQAQEAIFGIKEKYTELIDELSRRLPSRMRVVPIGDFYPAGDEVTLVYETVGRALQPGALPLSEGCVVQNVETLMNIGFGEPVVDKYLTVAGEVDHPLTVSVPVGTSFRDLLAPFRITTESFALVVGGLMMGRVERDLDAVITKCTGGVIVLPSDHHAVQTLLRSEDPHKVDLIAKASCDQCNYCTELCPRYLMGHPIRPETSMRNRMFDPGTNELVHTGSLFCCECNLCTMYACPEQLDPRGAAVIEKRLLRERGVKWQGEPTSVHPMAEYRKTPTARLIQKLGVAGYTNKGPLSELALRPERVRIPLSQHLGAPAVPAVTVGSEVERGALIGRANGHVSANIHASIKGTVAAVTEREVVIERRGVSS